MSICQVARSTANAPQTGPLLSETVSEFLVITDLDVYTGYGFTVTPFTEDSCNGGDVAGPVSSPAMGTTGELRKTKEHSKFNLQKNLDFIKLCSGALDSFKASST